MPHKPKPANPNHTVHLTIPIPGHLKNRLIQDAHNTGQTITNYVQTAITNQIRHNNNQPPLQNTQTNPLQPIINYLTGTRTLKPCGKTECNQKPITHNGHTYCDTCGIQTN